MANANTRLRLTNIQKGLICDQHLRNPNMTQTELGIWAQRSLSLSKPLNQKTVSRILGDADKIHELIDKGNTEGKSQKAQKMPDLDNDIEKYITDMNKSNNPVNRASVLAFARIVAHQKYKMHELPEHCRIKFSDGWMTKLFKRIGVKSRHLYGEEASVDVTTVNIIEQLKKIEEILEPYDPKDILNFDETGLYYEQQPTRSICKTPLGGSKKSKNRLTIGLLTNADGSYKGHPIVIGKNKSPRGYKIRKDLLRRMTVGNDTYVEYYYNPSAWMNAKIFEQYMTRLDRAFGYKNRKVAILLDNASVHKLAKEFSNIKLVFLPANTTSKLQPLDAGMYSNT